jgi:hypothetical protein
VLRHDVTARSRMPEYDRAAPIWIRWNTVSRRIAVSSASTATGGLRDRLVS